MNIHDTKTRRMRHAPALPEMLCLFAGMAAGYAATAWLGIDTGRWLLALSAAAVFVTTQVVQPGKLPSLAEGWSIALLLSAHWAWCIFVFGILIGQLVYHVLSARWYRLMAWGIKSVMDDQHAPIGGYVCHRCPARYGIGWWRIPDRVGVIDGCPACGETGAAEKKSGWPSIITDVLFQVGDDDTRETVTCLCCGTKYLRLRTMPPGDPDGCPECKEWSF